MDSRSGKSDDVYRFTFGGVDPVAYDRTGELARPAHPYYATLVWTYDSLGCNSRFTASRKGGRDS